MAFQTAVAFLALALMLLFFAFRIHGRMLKIETKIADLVEFKRKTESVLESVQDSVEAMNSIVETLNSAVRTMDRRN